MKTERVLDSSQDQTRAVRQAIRLLPGTGEAFGSLTGFQTIEAFR